MTVDDIYKLVITHLIKRFPISLEHYNYSDFYRANGDRCVRTRMVIRILGIDLAQLGWDDDGYGPVNSWDNLKKFEKYVS